MAKQLVRRERLWRHAVDTFIRVSSQVQSREHITYVPNRLDRRGYDLFYDHYEGNTFIGEDFITKFIEFGFQSWYNDKYRHKVENCHARSIRMNWVFSAKALKRYDTMNALGGVEQVVRTNLATRYDVREEVQHNEQYERAVTEVRDAEERFKAQSYSTDDGLATCLYSTTLYNHLSKLCARCANAIECKELLRANYPRIYDLRGYGIK